jgi:hypothetical protein
MAFLPNRVTRKNVEDMLSIVAARANVPMALDTNSHKRIAVFTAYWRCGVAGEYLQLDERVTEYLSTRECYAYLSGVLRGMTGF